MIDCAGCGWCCEEIPYLQMYPPEYKHLVDAVPAAAKMARKIGQMYYIETRFGQCPFHDAATKKCKIYDVRPTICREYPFVLMPSVAALAMDRKEPGFDIEKHVFISISCKRIGSVDGTNYRKCLASVRKGFAMACASVDKPGWRAKMKEQDDYFYEVTKKPHRVDKDVPWAWFRDMLRFPSFMSFVKAIVASDVPGERITRVLQEHIDEIMAGRFDAAMAEIGIRATS